ncbi:MAG: S-layer homology domain-containing protein [Clostridia bacterium]|nr:S-layer homology domain-containing protein [Clostridia bacterium]
MKRYLPKALAALISLLLIIPILPTFRASAVENALLSPGLLVLAADCEMHLSVPRGGEAQFSTEDFVRATGIDELGFITVKSHPDTAKGQLTVGSIIVPGGQSVRSGNLSRLSFSASADAAEGDSAVFTYTADGSPYEFVCRITVTDAARTNSAPTLKTASAAALKANAYAAHRYGGVLAGSDPDGDTLYYLISRYPSHGSITITDRATGAYIYTPEDGYSGKDSFSYVLCDEHGSYAEGEATVSVSVSRYLPLVKYADVSGTALTAALTVTAAGIMDGDKLGEEHYFEPDASVSRIEFLSALMTSAGIDDLPSVEKTVFADDADIPDGMRAYVAAAYELGYTSGWISDGKHCFLPNEEITVAEAAALTAAVLDIKLTGAVPASVGERAPAWARSAISAVTECGFPLGEVSATATLTRLDAAHLLSAVIRYCE